MRKAILALAATLALAGAGGAGLAHADALNAPAVQATAPERSARTYESIEAALLAADLDQIVADARAREGLRQASARDAAVLTLDALLADDFERAQTLADRYGVALFAPFIKIARGEGVLGIVALQEAAAQLPAPMADLGAALALEAAGQLDDAAVLYAAIERDLETAPLEGEPRSVEDVQRALAANRTAMTLMRAAVLRHRLGDGEEADRLYALTAGFTPQSATLRAERERLAQARPPRQAALDWRTGLGRWLLLLSDFASQTEGFRAVLAADGPLEGLSSATAALYAQFGVLFDPAAEDWVLAAAADLRAARGYAGADRLLSRISRRSPYAADAFLARAEIALLRGEDAAARRAALEAVRTNDPRWAVKAGAGDVLRQVGADREAVRALSEALASAETPEDRAKVLSYRAFAHRFAGRFEAAADDARAALALDRSDNIRLFFISILMDHPTAWEEAIREARAMLSESPDSVLRLNALGYSLIQRPEGLEEGFRLLWRGYAFNPRNEAVVDSLGWAYYLYGKFEEARVLIERANELSGNEPNAEILDHLGDVYWRLGRQEDARRIWREALAARPDVIRRAALEAKLREGLLAPAPEEQEPPQVSAPERRRAQEDT